MRLIVRLAALLLVPLFAAAAEMPPPAAASDPTRPLAAVLIDRMCNKTLRPNEDDRLMGMISIAVRATIRYRGGVFSPDLIDDAVQQAVGALVAACPQLAAADDPQRLGMMIHLAEATTEMLLADKTHRYSPHQLARATAADLSEELSTDEIDAWLNDLPPRQRALALFLYASDIRPEEAAGAVGLTPKAIGPAFSGAKTGLMHFFRNDAAPPAAAAGKTPAMQINDRGAFGQPFAALLNSATAKGAGPATAPAAESAAATQPPILRITGISSEIYAGWSLLATVTGLDHGQPLDIAEPFLLDPDKPGCKRMIVADAVEISGPADNPRRFLLKAYAIDPDAAGSGVRDTFHFGAARIDNPQALQTLRNRRLSSIEVARCLGHDYGGTDPGLCR